MSTIEIYLPHSLSSERSGQSFLPSQRTCASMQVPSSQVNSDGRQRATKIN